MLTPTLLYVAAILGLPLGGRVVHSVMNTKFPDLDYVFGKNGDSYSLFSEANGKDSGPISDT